MVDAQINHKITQDYWQGIDANVNGMLGGYPSISRIDLQGSKDFLEELGIGGKNGRKVERAVDCGAGIGRITEDLLVGIADIVDIIEPIAKFTDGLKEKDGVGNIFNIGLEEWSPKESLPKGVGYDLIWNQWCLCYLTDSQLVVYLKKCNEALVSGGYVIVKENILRNKVGSDLFYEVDSSVTRTDEKFRALFDKAGLNIKVTELQGGLPQGLYPVRVYALQASPSL